MEGPGELRGALELHKLWLMDKRGKRFDMQGAYLCGVYLRRAVLENARLEGANLAGANLEGANLSCSNLQGANLSGANLEGANLSGADLLRADLTGAELDAAYLFGADLTDACLDRVSLRYATGNCREVKSMHVHYWPVVWTRSSIWIGCKEFTHEEFRALTPERAEEMHEGRGFLCRKYKPIILNLIVGVD